MAAYMAGSLARINAGTQPWSKHEVPQPERDFDHLDGAGRSVAGLSLRPAVPVWWLLGAAVLFSWTMLAAMAARNASMLPETAGPGAGLLGLLPDIALPDFLERFFQLCLTPVSAAAGFDAFAASTAMWFLMALAMMLPSATPMIRTYCEIADTAGAKGEPVAHPLVLVSGYLAVWLAASVGFALLASAVGSGSAPLPFAASAVALATAGLYQFSRLKDACLEKCRNPFAILFANWSPEPAKILRLGMVQGLYCLGCCWALMLVMFAVGTFNLFWMALIGVLAIVEKQGHRLVTRSAGALLVVWALALIVVSVA